MTGLISASDCDRRTAMSYANLKESDKQQLADIIADMSRMSLELAEKRDWVIAKGVPGPQFIQLVTMKLDDAGFDIKPAFAAFEKAVVRKFGPGSFDYAEIEDALQFMLDGNKSLAGLRRAVHQFDIDPFAVNKLVELRCRSPLDSGMGLVTEIASIAGMKASEASNQPDISSGENTETTSLKTRKRDSAGALVWLKSRYDQFGGMLKDVTLGVGLGVVAILLLV